MYTRIKTRKQTVYRSVVIIPGTSVAHHPIVSVSDREVRIVSLPEM